MKFSEVAGRLNGLSTPIFGLSWSPPRSDVVVAREVLTFLEDRRALYRPYMVEDPKHVLMSVLQIRDQMTRALAPGGLSDELSSALRRIRAACRQFMDRVGVQEHQQVLHLPRTGLDVPRMHDISLNQALGELRGAVGPEIARIAAAHGLDVEDELASILPAVDID